MADIDYNDNPDAVLLNPTKLEQMERLKQLKEDLDFKRMPKWLQEWLDGQIEHPSLETESATLNSILDYLQNPENSILYRNQILFPHASEYIYDPEGAPDWKFEIPIISIDF